MQLPDISERRGLGREAQDEFLQEIYDVSQAGGDDRDLAWKKVFAGSAAKISRRPHHPADDKAAIWMGEERQRAYERSERRWKRQFQQWCSDYLAERRLKLRAKKQKKPSESPSSAHESAREGFGENGLAEMTLEERAEAAEGEIELLREEKEGYYEQLARRKAEVSATEQQLQEERERTATAQRRWAEIVQETHAWKNRAMERDQSLRQANSSRQLLTDRFAKLCAHFADLSSRTSGLQAESAADPGEDLPVEEYEDDDAEYDQDSPLARTSKMELQGDQTEAFDDETYEDEDPESPLAQSGKSKPDIHVAGLDEENDEYDEYEDEQDSPLARTGKMELGRQDSGDQSKDDDEEYEEDQDGPLVRKVNEENEDYDEYEDDQRSQADMREQDAERQHAVEEDGDEDWR